MARFMAFVSKQAGGTANDTSLLEDEDYDVYDGYENEAFGLTKQQLTFCNALDITLRGQVKRQGYFFCHCESNVILIVVSGCFLQQVHKFVCYSYDRYGLKNKCVFVFAYVKAEMRDFTRILCI